MVQSRRLIYKWPPARKAEARSKTIYFIMSQKGTPMKRVKYECELCGKKDLKRKEVNLDHIDPVIDPLKGWESMDVYFDRLFCSEDKLQMICLDCHSKKTEAERVIRGERNHDPDVLFGINRKKKV